MRLIDPKAKTNLLYVSDMAFEQMQKIPTIDAEVVVRCKDCKRMRELAGNLVCDHALPTRPLTQYFEMGRDILAVVEPDEFCSRGERKDGVEL